MQKSKVSLLLLTCLLNSSIGQAQGETNNWFFGTNAGISFSGGAPVSLPNGALISGEGVSSISDAGGNILIYTDGTTVYDRNDNIMPNGNGLFGGNSSSQSAVIIKRPGSNSIYYVFTVAQAALPEGICYSTVNMTLNGGFGDVVNATKNTSLVSPSTEKLSAVKHCNGRDVWVIGHGYNNSTFHAWLVTPAGVNAVPVNSVSGSDHGTSVIGCLKVSPDGKRLALAVYEVGSTQYIEVFDFNNNTGVVSNPRRFNYGDDCYGIEFSPNSELLYYTASASSSSADIKVYQMDVCETTQANMAASAQIIGASSAGFIRSLQLGPDGKLYFTRFGQGWIGVIDSPNTPGVGCGFNVNGVALSPGTTCRAGLPNFNQSLFEFEEDFTFTQNCLSATFSSQIIIDEASCNDPVVQTLWNFGEPSSGAANTSSNNNPSHTYANPGNYTVRLILNYSCKRDTLYEVLNINCGPQVTLRDTAICTGTCATINSTTIGGTPGYTYSWSPNIGVGPGPFSVCPVSTTNYIVTVTDANGLIDKDTATVTISTVPIPTFTYDHVNCFGGTDGDVTALATGAGGPFTYSWNTIPATNTAALINVAAGTYQVTVRNAANCTRTANATITQPTQLTLTVNKTNTGCGVPTGTATAVPSGGTAPYVVTWNSTPSQTGLTANALPAGNFIATVTDANGCVQTQAFTINSSSGPTLNLTSSTNVTCNGGTNGTATVVASAGATPYAYSWSTGQTTATVNNLPAGNHSATVTDNNGCSSSVPVVITSPTAIQIQTSFTTASCGLANGSATALASGGTPNYTYSWNTTPVQNTALANNIIAGNYTVTATDASGCSNTATATVTGTSNPTINIAKTNVSCNGGNNGTATATVGSGTAPYSVTWSNAATGLTVNNLIAGNYTATVTDAAGCTATANFTITQPTAISLATSSTAATCGSSNGSATVVISGGTGPFTTQWNTTPVSNGLIINNIPAGSYIVTVTDNNSCTANTTVAVSNSSGPTLNLTASTNVTCNGGTNGTATVVASAGATPYTYSWSTGQTTATVNNLPAGNHTSTVTDNNGCSSSVPVVISSPTAIQIQTSITTASCGLANGSATALASGGTPNYTYSWNATPVQNTATANNIIAGNYTVTATDASGCSATATATVTGTSNPTISIAKTNVSCNGGNNGTATATVGAGTAPFSVTWSNAATGLSVNNLNAGNYTATVTDAAGCTATANFTITQPTAISLATSSTAATCGSSNGSASVVISGGTGPFSTQWNTTPVSSGLSINNIPEGSYIVTVTDNNNCTANTTVAVSNSSGPTLNLTSSTNVTCNGGTNGTATVVASAGATPYAYSWSTGQTTATVNNLPAGNHTATVTDNNGCSSSVPVVISSPTAIQIQTSITTASCGLANGSATALASGGTPNYTYSWNATPVQNTATANNIITGNYTVTATDASGCSNTATATVTGTSNPTINIAKTNVSCNGGNNGTATATVGSGTAPYSVTWSNAATGLTVNNLIAGNFTATVTDAAGCTATANFTITQQTAISLATFSTAATCGSSNGSATVVISGGTGPFSTQWNTAPVSNGLSINNIPAGSYIVTVTDNNSCTANTTVAVSNSSGPTLNLTSSTNVTCNGGTNGTATVVASAGATPYTYSWSTGQNTATVNNLPAGNHTATVTDNNGCSSSVPVVITSPTVIQIQTSFTTASCGLANGSATALASGGTPNYTYSWNATPVQNTALANNIIAGNYTVTATDASGCSATSAATVTGTSNPTINIAKTNVSCNGGNNGTATATVGSGTAPYSVTWSNAATGLTVNNLVAGNYTATVTDAAGCLAGDSDIISEPNQITTQLNISDAACGTATGGANLIINGGTAPYAISWNSLPIQNGLSLTNVLAGLYTAQVTDANGCTLNVNAQINNLSGPQITIVSNNNVNCFNGNDGAIEVSISGGQAPLALAWNSGQNSTTISSLIAGTYTATLTDAIGCSSNISIVLSEPTALQAAISTAPTTCGNNNGTATVLVNGGVAPYSFDWNNGGNGNASISTLASGNNQVIVSDANGCAINENFTVLALNPPSVSISIDQNITCPGGSNGSLSATVNQGEAPFIYNWSTGNSSTVISNLNQGNYSLTITDNNGCIANDVLQLDAPSPWSNIIIPQASTCGNNNGSALLLLNGATSPYSVIWSDGQTLPNALNLLAGNYTVAISDANGCSKTEQTTIFDIGGLGVVLNQTQQISCFGFNDAEISATGNGGIPPYSFSWSNGQNANLATGVAPGNISCSITDANGCVASSSLNISQPAAITATFTTQHTTCNLNNGNTSINVSGGTAPYSYTWQNGNQSNLITSLASGQVSCTISDLNGCTAVFSENINASLGLTASLNIDQSISCFQGTNGAISVNSNSSLSATWSNNTIGLTNANLGAANYSVIVVDTDACRDTLSITLSEPTPISATYLNTEAVCSLSNGTSIIDISGGTSPYNCVWGNGLSGLVNNNLLPGNQNVVVEDANGCIFNSTTTINQIFPLQIDSIIVTPTTCFGEVNGLAAAIISGNTGNISFNWSNGAENLAINDSLMAGNYSVSITDEAGCNDAQSFSITQPLALQNTLQTENVRCFGENSGSAVSTVSGGTGPYIYYWNQSIGGDTLNFLPVGIYSITILDAFGCSRTDSFSIQQPTILQAVINKTNSTCGFPNGQMEVLANGGTTPYQYVWTNGTQLNQIDSLFAGDYSVIVTDANNCFVNTLETIVDPGAPVIDTISIQQIDCFGNSTGFVQVGATGGVGNKAFTWNTGENSTVIINKIAGFYTVIAQDQIGCSDTLNIQLTEPQKLESTTTTSMAICFGSSTGQANVEATGGTPPYSYYWNQNQNQQSFLSQVLAGLYTVSVSDANGCITADTAVISQPTALQLDITASPALCYGQASGTANAVISGGIPPYNLGWNNGVAGNFIDQLIAGNYNIVATDSNGCTISQGVEVAQPLPLNGLVSGDLAACKGDSIQMVVSGEGGTYPFTYLWENGDNNTNTTLTPDSSGFAIVVTTDANGCIDTSSRQYRIFDLPVLSIVSPDTSLCAGQCINLKVADVAGGQFVWNFLNNGNLLGQTAEFCSNTVGKYDIHIEVTDVNSCFSSLDLPGYIQVNPNPIVDFEPEKRTVPLLDAFIKFDNNSIGAVSYLWDLDPDISGDESTLIHPSHQYIEVGSYEVTLTGTNEFGCSATISRYVDILADFAVYIPNAFTPNADGLNDTFQPSGIGIDPSDYFMQIYDRWGKLLFETDIWSKGWDGTIENAYGESEQAGNVYVYKMRVKDFRGDYHKFNGTATLVR